MGRLNCSVPSHAIREYKANLGTVTSRLNLGTGLRTVVIFMLQPLYPRERVAGSHGIGRCLSTGPGLDVLGKR